MSVFENGKALAGTTRQPTSPSTKKRRRLTRQLYRASEIVSDETLVALLRSGFATRVTAGRSVIRVI